MDILQGCTLLKNPGQGNRPLGAATLGRRKKSPGRCRVCLYPVLSPTSSTRPSPRRSQTECLEASCWQWEGEGEEEGEELGVGEGGVAALPLPLPPLLLWLPRSSWVSRWILTLSKARGSACDLPQPPWKRWGLVCWLRQSFMLVTIHFQWKFLALEFMGDSSSDFSRNSNFWILLQSEFSTFEDRPENFP